MSKNELLKALTAELKVADLFRHLGYFTRAHIDIFPYESTRKVSDIDVFGIRFDAQLTSYRVVAEVKESGCPSTDILKLHGLGAYLSHCNCYFVTGSSNLHCTRIARDLDIKLATLNKLKKVIGKAPSGFITSNPQDIMKTFDYLDSLKKNADKNLYWRYYFLWLEKDPFMRLYHQQNLFDSASEHLGSKSLNDAAEWFRRELFLLSQISILEIASDCVGVQDDQIDNYLEDRFSNLGASRKSKEKIIEGVGRLVSIIEKLSDQKVKPPSIEILPAYLPTLAELVRFILSSAGFSQQYLLRNNDLHLLKLRGEDARITDVVSSRQLKFLTKFNDLVGRVLHNGPLNEDFKDFI